VRQLLRVVPLALLLGACSYIPNPFADLFPNDEDTSDPPAELVPLQDPLPVTRLWSSGAGSGTEERRLNLRVAVAPDRVFATDHKGNVFALDAASGDELWDTDTDVEIAGGPGYGEGLVFVGGGDGELIALDAATGEESWRVELTSEVLSVPTAASGVVVVHTVDGKLWGLEATDGSSRWILDHQVPALSLRGIGSPVIDRGLVLGGFASGKLEAVSLSDGRKLWDASISSPRGRSELERLVDVDSEPVVHAGVVYVASFQGRVAAVSRDAGVVFWRREISSYAGLDVDSSQVYVTDSSGYVWGLDINNGAALWKQDGLFARKVTAPVVHGEYVVVGDLEGYLHWLSPQDGSFVARTQIDDGAITTPPVAVDDTLYVYSDAGTVAAVRVGVL